MNFPKVIKVGRTPEQHRALRMRSFESGKSMCEVVRAWIEVNMVENGVQYENGDTRRPKTVGE